MLVLIPTLLPSCNSTKPAPAPPPPPADTTSSVHDSGIEVTCPAAESTPPQNCDFWSQYRTIVEVEGATCNIEGFGWICVPPRPIGERCVELFGPGEGGCPSLREFLAESGWLAGSTTTALRGLDVDACTDADGNEYYSVFWVTEPPTVPPGADTSHGHTARFDASGSLIAILDTIGGLYPHEAWCCDGTVVTLVGWGAVSGPLSCTQDLFPEDFEDSGLP